LVHQLLSKIILPWFRVHIILLNDPGRLISVHIMHSALVAGWSGVMGLYELILLDTSDAVYNPMWRQGCYVLPFISRLGVVSSIYNWNIGIISSTAMQWSYELVIIAHLVLSGLLIGAAFWHWCYWDLDVFLSSRSGKLVIDLNRVFGIHLALASTLCIGFGLCHLTGYFGPGFWTSDSVGLLGSIRYIKPTYSIIGLTPYCYGVISSHHISAGVLGLSYRCGIYQLVLVHRSIACLSWDHWKESYRVV